MSRNRRSRRTKWEDPVSLLQAARFQRRWLQLEACREIRQVCPGHGRGKPCRIEPSKLSDYERGQRFPSMKHLLALCAVYDKSAAELGLVRRADMPALHLDQSVANGAENSSETNQTWTGYAVPNEATQSSEGGTGRGQLDDDVLLAVLLRVLLGVGRGEHVRRDDFIKGIGAAAGAAFMDPFVVLSQDAQAQIHHTKISDDQIKRLSGAAYTYARGAYQKDQAKRMEGLVTDWTTAHRLLGQPQTLRQRLELTNAYARLSGVLSLCAGNEAHYARSQALRETAQEAARETGDLEVLGWMYERSCEAADSRGTALDVVEASGRGLAAIGPSQSLTAARLHGWAARGYASLGDEQAAKTHLETATRIFGKGIPGCWPNDAGMPRGYTFAEDGLASATGDAYLRMGSYRVAIEYCERAEALHTANGLSLRNAPVFAHNRLHHASALLHTGEVEGATQSAISTVSGYEGIALPSVMVTARRFQHDLVSVDTGGAYAKQFSEFLRNRAA